MRMVIEDHSLLRDAIQAINELIDEGVFKFNQKGLEFVSTDRAVIAVVAFHLSRERFKEYETEDEEIGLSVDDLLKFLKRGSSSERLTIEKDENAVMLVFEGRTKRSFRLPMIRIPESEQSIEKITERITEFKAEIDLPPTIIANAIEDASLISDSVIFLVEDGKLTIRAEGTTKESETVVEQGDGITIKAEEPARSRFSIEYLKKIMKGSKVGSSCKLFLGNNYPMKIVFSDQGVRLGYILAPRKED